MKSDTASNDGRGAYGWRTKRLYETRIGKWLSLVRIQSIPLTAVTLCIGYITVQETLSSSVLPLIIVGAFGHAGFYGLNDFFDYGHDLNQGKEDKPLIDGEMNRTTVWLVCWSLIILSVVGAMLWFPPLSVAIYLIAAVFGYVYNRYSKVNTFSSLYLSVWGGLIVVTGSTYAGRMNVNTLLIASVFALHMFWMTMMGDIRDVTGDENNIFNYTGCNYLEADDKIRFYFSNSFTIYATAVPVLGQTLLVSLFIIYNDGGLITLLVSSIFLLLFGTTSFEIASVNKVTITEITKSIVIAEVAFVISIIIALASITNYQNLSVLLVGSVVWGVGWLKILYGSFTQFG